MKLDGEDCFNNLYYAHIRQLLTITGLWPYLETSKRLPYVFLITILMFVGIYSQVYLLVISERKVEPIIELLQTLLPTALFAFVYWNLFYNPALMMRSLERVRNDWNDRTCEDEWNIMHIYALRSKLYSKVVAGAIAFYSVCLISPSIWCLFSHISGIVNQTEFILPVYSDLFMTTESTYFIAFSFEIIIITTASILGITHYSMFILLLQHSCALFTIVTNKIDQPFIKNEYKFCWTQTGTNKREAELEWIVAVVNNYNNAIKFVELIRSLYGKLYVVEVFVFLCAFIVDFTYMIRFLSLAITAREGFKMCFFINGSVLPICAYFNLGEKLMEHSTSVYAKCRLVPFYTLTVKTNKLFILLIMRSMKPCNISFGGVVVASHELFVKMMKVSFSFATILYNVR